MANDYLGQMGLGLSLWTTTLHCWPRTEIISSHVSMCREGWPASLSWANFSVLSLSTSAYTEGWVSIWGSDSDDGILIFPSYVVVQSLSRVWPFETPWTTACQGFLSFTIFFEFTQIHVHWVGDATQPSHPLSPLLLLPSIFPSIKVFSNDSALHIRWPKYWSFSFSISPSNEYSELISFRID